MDYDFWTKGLVVIMSKNSIHGVACNNEKCKFAGKFNRDNIVKHGWFKVKRGRRQSLADPAAGR